MVVSSFRSHAALAAVVALATILVLPNTAVLAAQSGRCDLCSGRGGNSTVLALDKDLTFIPALAEFADLLGTDSCADFLVDGINNIVDLLSSNPNVVNAMTEDEACGAFQTLGVYCGCTPAAAPCGMCFAGRTLDNPEALVGGTAFEAAARYIPSCDFYENTVLPNFESGSAECKEALASSAGQCTCSAAGGTNDGGGGGATTTMTTTTGTTTATTVAMTATAEVTEYCSYKGAVSRISFCTNGGECIAKVGEGEAHLGCDCPDEYEGDHCEFVKGGTQKPPSSSSVEGIVECPDLRLCENGSLCYENPGLTGNYSCDCDGAFVNNAAFAGLSCEHEATEYCSYKGAVSRISFCTNGGECIAKVGEGEAHLGCDCPDEYEGDHCEFVKGSTQTTAPAAAATTTTAAATTDTSSAAAPATTTVTVTTYPTTTTTEPMIGGTTNATKASAVIGTSSAAEVDADASNTTAAAATVAPIGNTTAGPITTETTAEASTNTTEAVEAATPTTPTNDTETETTETEAAETTPTANDTTAAVPASTEQPPFTCDLCNNRGGNSQVLSLKKDLTFLPALANFGPMLGADTCDKFITGIATLMSLLADESIAVDMLGMGAAMAVEDSCDAFQKLGVYCGCNPAAPPCGVCEPGQGTLLNPEQEMSGTTIEALVQYTPTCGFYDEVYLANNVEGSETCTNDRAEAANDCKCSGPATVEPTERPTPRPTVGAFVDASNRGSGVSAGTRTMSSRRLRQSVTAMAAAVALLGVL